MKRVLTTESTDSTLGFFSIIAAIRGCIFYLALTQGDAPNITHFFLSPAAAAKYLSIFQPHIPLQASGLALHAGLPTVMAAAITQA